MTLTKFFDDFYRPLKLRGRSASTVRLYRNTIKQYSQFLGREATVEEDLNDLQVSRFLEARAERRSAFTAEKERNQLCALWRCASDRRLCDYRPTIPPSVLPARVPKAWSIDELKALLNVAKVATGKIGDVPAHVFWTAFISVLWESAERCGAILAVETHDYVRPTILVRAEHRKGGKRDKLYTFTPKTCELLDVLAKANVGRKLFHWPLDRLYIWNRFGKLVKKAGIETGSRCKFHQLRRSAATHFAARGGDPTALLDHSSPRVTKAYLDPRYLDSGPKPCDILPDIN